MTDEPQEDTLIYHLEALRSLLIRCFAALAVGLLPMFLLAPGVLDILLEIMLAGNKVSVNFFAPLEIFILQLKMAFLLDVLVCFPYIAKQIWLFLLPALYDNERRFIKSIVLTSASLFILGVLFCLFFILPLVIRFGLSFATDNIHPMFGIGNIISTALWLSVIFGVMFQFPLITYSLIRWNVFAYETVKNKRAYVFLGILILSGLLTPPDIVSQLLLTLPTYGLFEAGLLAAKNKNNY